ncbi:MAG: DUF262 domain-containing protein [Oscillospiraceae bacterium]|jgi:5-methylcytosine-specific restriction endonuclease McrA|nr:DUF262 domain-containing protein [Oscillospiraceae bacterium]
MTEMVDDLVVHTEQKDFTLYQLREMVDANDLVTDPDYQRKYVYNDKQASLLVESILIGIPIPVIYLCEESEGVFSVIDGQQRITSFVRYLKNDFALTGLVQRKDLNGLEFKNLDKATQRRLKSKALKAICLDRDSQDLKFDIFSRLNLGAVKLKDQEVRNCVFRGSFNDMLKEIAKSNAHLRAMFHDANKRFAYEERILRFFALRDYLNLHGTYKQLMHAYMKTHQNDTSVDINRAKGLYTNIIDTVNQVLGENAFYASPSLRKFNGSVYDSIVIPFSYFQRSAIIRNADKIRVKINEMKETDKEYKEFVYVGTNAGRRVRGRMEKVMAILNSIISENSSQPSTRVFPKEYKELLFQEGYICSYCGQTILDVTQCEIDHIIPFSQGGPTTLENAQLLHRYCNRTKADKVMSPPEQNDLDYEDDSEEESESPEMENA